MEKLHRTLQPFARITTISVLWLFTAFWFYLCFVPLIDYADAAGLNKVPTCLDAMHYYTPEKGYQVLTDLEAAGRQAYRWTNYADFVLPILLFLSFSLGFVAFSCRPECLILPLGYMIADYSENIAEKYVLEIYPERNDAVMTVACYLGLAKFSFFYTSLLIIIVCGSKTGLKYFLVKKDN